MELALQTEYSRSHSMYFIRQVLRLVAFWTQSYNIDFVLQRLNCFCIAFWSIFFHFGQTKPNTELKKTTSHEFGLMSSFIQTLFIVLTPDRFFSFLNPFIQRFNSFPMQINRKCFFRFKNFPKLEFLDDNYFLLMLIE